ncbi:glycosyltransferase family 4 protein [Dyadobacter pollutisoli]|uniref:Glycosyltransferase family 4 protein n=1 Tax=Dyadobacter pollutisoli TaxID=2910158 RepID=A0A9E8NBP2_9BACT|nr:glycosyltransferase family 4 protein [Dyadobacter pollutisoli]WAC13699.1 glycosyltransferase family 4 protein [Dyadobacter pollutisoli]
MRVLIVHNQLWAHYKSRLFSEINRSLREKEPESDFLVVQIALFEASRSVMQNDDTVRYEYPYQVLFDRALDSVAFGERRKALFAAFRSYKPTVLNITGYFDWAQVLLMFYARMKGVKVVISSESSSMDHNRSAIKEAIKKFIVNRANAFFCFGKSSAVYLENLGVKPDDIAVRNAAVIDEEFIKTQYDQAKEKVTPDTNIRRFIYVGRLAPEKNLELMLHAFSKFRDENWELLLVGDGPSRALLENLANELDINAKVQFAGGFPWYQVPDWLAKSDVLILPSKSEPWGLVVNEAMVCGMPVIVSSTCGCAEDLVRNRVNGFSFDPEKQSGLETAMDFFVRYPDNIALMGKESLKLIAPFSSGKVALQMVKCYQKLEQSK